MKKYCPVCNARVYNNHRCCSRKCSEQFKEGAMPITKNMLTQAIRDYKRGKTLQWIADRNKWDLQVLIDEFKKLIASGEYQQIVKEIDEHLHETIHYTNEHYDQFRLYDYQPNLIKG